MTKYRSGIEVFSRLVEIYRSECVLSISYLLKVDSLYLSEHKPGPKPKMYKRIIKDVLRKQSLPLLFLKDPGSWILPFYCLVYTYVSLNYIVLDVL